MATRQEAPKQIHYDSVSFVKIDQAFALVARGITINPTTITDLAGLADCKNEIGSLQKREPRFDMIYLLTNEIIAPQPEPGRIADGMLGMDKEYYTQSLLFRLTLLWIFKNNSSTALHAFAKRVTEHFPQPFLVIYGHGKAERPAYEKGNRWTIGEIGTDARTDISTVLKRFVRTEHSAVLMCVCNPGNFEPRRIPNVPIFYVKGDVGGTDSLSCVWIK